jgi:hypothetical protein
MSILLATLALAIQLHGDPPARFEDFDERGTTWAATIFPEVNAGSYSREPLTTALGAPDTVPPLPINAGGDLEGRYVEALASTFTLAANEPANRFEDGGIRGYLGFGVTSSFGSQSVGFLLRASINPSPPFGSGLNAYTAYVDRSTATQAILHLARWRDGVVTDVFASADITVHPGQENLLLEFEVQGSYLAARLWRVTAVSGRLVTAPVALAPAPGVLGNLLWAEDGELVRGRAGVHAFTRSSNSVFFDDVLVKVRSATRTAP